MAEPTEMQFGMLGRVGPGNVFRWCSCPAPTGSGTFVVSGRLKSIVKCRILGAGQADAPLPSLSVSHTRSLHILVFDCLGS